MMQMITVYIGCKRYMRPDMGHTHRACVFDASGLSYPTCIMNCCKAWEVFICSAHHVGFSISQQVKLYNPETRGNQRYLTENIRIPKYLCFFFVTRPTWCSYLVSTPLKFPLASLEQCIARCSPAFCVPSSHCRSGTAWSCTNLLCRPWWAVHWGRQREMGPDRA